jgi:hypothetical protein
MENITVNLLGKQYVIEEPNMRKIIKYEKLIYKAETEYEFDKFDLKEFKAKANAFYCLTSLSDEIGKDFAEYDFGTLPLIASEEFVNEYIDKVMPWYFDGINKVQEAALAKK